MLLLRLGLRLALRRGALRAALALAALRPLGLAARVVVALRLALGAGTGRGRGFGAGLLRGVGTAAQLLQLGSQVRRGPRGLLREFVFGAVVGASVIARDSARGAKSELGGLEVGGAARGARQRGRNILNRLSCRISK